MLQITYNIKEMSEFIFTHFFVIKVQEIIELKLKTFGKIETAKDSFKKSLPI